MQEDVNAILDLTEAHTCTVPVAAHLREPVHATGPARLLSFLLLLEENKGKHACPCLSMQSRACIGPACQPGTMPLPAGRQRAPAAVRTLFHSERTLACCFCRRSASFASLASRFCVGREVVH